MVNQAKIARYRHLVFHILEFLQKHQLYPDEQILKFKIELLNKTNKSLHHTEDAPQGIIIYGGRAAPLVTFLLNPNAVQELRGDKQYNLQMLKERYQVVFWWPFTQHKLVHEETVTVIDSRYGENFSVYKGSGNDSITQQFDACASWWTQGPDPAFQAELAREMAYTAARFGHVMFPENVYEPALKCDELLIDGVGKGWASRVYFSDNGSTAIEIALKMAFRKFCVDHETLLEFSEGRDEKKHIVVKVYNHFASGSYHGDTLGTMEAQAPSPYTGFLQQPWYTGRGLFLDPPTGFLSNGAWNLSLPEFFAEIAPEEYGTFSTRDEIFDKSRDTSTLATTYSAYVSKQLQEYSGNTQSAHIQTTILLRWLIVSAVIHGAGGMHMVDLLFQRVLVNECRNRKIPVIFD
uniref:Eukaryotic translation initiation factor 3 subunit E N-terminal domain-containing protein n=1 Tax=Brassica campestris TaxID=3711 RepID=A0A3P6AYW5_BRACM|nr:unnamed protein product [Brassica rapa]